ncbi:MAG: signal peptidase II [Acidobacteria bacterium]|nr:signal peptidase II [Acidobacteriota bacterium]
MSVTRGGILAGTDGRSVRRALPEATVIPTAPTSRAVSPGGHNSGSADRRRAALVAATVAAGAVALDQVTKAIAAAALASGPAHVGILHLRLVANRGIFMGMIGVPTWLITLLTLTIVAVAARAVWRGGTSQSVAYALLIGGAVGNLLDRYLQRTGFPSNAVVDWLSFGGMTFNLADVFIVTAVLLLLGQESREQATVVGVGVAPRG